MTVFLHFSLKNTVYIYDENKIKFTGAFINVPNLSIVFSSFVEKH